jgi:dienelactone hydrolase
LTARAAAALVVAGALAGCGGAHPPRPVARAPVAERVFEPPPGVRAGAPVVLWGGSTGGLPPARLARSLAGAGHPTLALAYFGVPGLPRDLERIPLEYFAHAVARFGRRSGVDASRMVVFGVSRGTEAALLLGAHFPRLVHGVIAIAPSSKVNPAVHGGGPSWLLRGRALPTAIAFDAKGGFDAPSIIPVERIRGPVLLAAGTRDRIWDSRAYEAAIVRRLRRHGFRHRVVALLYRGAGHALTGRRDLHRSIERFLDSVGR